MTEQIKKFWTCFWAWNENSDNVNKYYKDEYVHWDYWNNGHYSVDIDYDEEYRLKYGKPFDVNFFSKDCPDIDEIIEYIEIMYERWIKTETHYDFTIKLNDIFERFTLPYHLLNGKVIRKGHHTSEHIDEILDYKMFESKLEYARVQIESHNVNDKKAALNTIVACLQYYLSLFDGKDKYKLAAESVCNNPDSKIYEMVKRDINEIMAMANNYFDVRHNEKLNQNKENREVLTDAAFIEYLFNRVYSLLYLLRLKKNNAKIIDLNK